MATHILAMGGGGFSEEGPGSALDGYLRSLLPEPRPRVLFLPTASGDSDDYVVRFYQAFPADRWEPSHLSLFRRPSGNLGPAVLAQDAIYVGGGNTANLLALWRLHGLDGPLREAWRRGIVLAGVSAGALCWFEGGVTDSFGTDLAPLRDGLGLVPGTFCPHYDGEELRRPTYLRLVAESLPGGFAVDDGVAVHLVDGRLHRVVSGRRAGRAFRVERVAGEARETALEVEPLLEGPGAPPGG